MFAPGHNFTPTMPMKYTVHLRTPNAVARFFLICSPYFVDVQHLPFFCLFTKLLKKLSFFLYAHVSAVSKIMLFRYSLQAFLKILSDKVTHMRTMKLCARAA